MFRPLQQVQGTAALAATGPAEKLWDYECSSGCCFAARESPPHTSHIHLPTPHTHPTHTWPLTALPSAPTCLQIDWKSLDGADDVLAAREQARAESESLRRELSTVKGALSLVTTQLEQERSQSELTNTYPMT